MGKSSHRVRTRFTSGTVQITDPGPVSDGTHTYQVFLTDLAGNKSALSKSLTVTFAPMHRVRRSSPWLPSRRGSRGATSPVSPPTWSSPWRPPWRPTPSSCSVHRRVHPRAPRSSVPPRARVRSPIPVRSCPVPTSTRRGRSTQFNTVSLPSTPLDVTIVTTATAPTRVRLDPSSESGTPGSNVTNVTANLVFDVFGISAGTTSTAVREQLASQQAHHRRRERRRRRSPAAW